MKQVYKDLALASTMFMVINIGMILMGKTTWYDFIFYTTIIAFCDFVVAIYVQIRFETVETMGKMADSVEDLLKKLSKKKGKKRLAKALKKEIEKAKVDKIVSEVNDA